VYKCKNPTNEYYIFEEKYYAFVDLVMLIYPEYQGGKLL
jgi:hypothetical protein